MSWYKDYAADKAVKDQEAARQAAKRNRDTALAGMVHTFADGRVVQVRPNDLPNFQTAIAIGSDQNWVMADNTTRMTTTAEMQDAVNAAVVQAQAIWSRYADDLDAL